MENRLKSDALLTLKIREALKTLKQGWGVHPPMPIIHIAYSPYFRKIYKFTLLFPKIYKFSPIFVKFTFFRLI